MLYILEIYTKQTDCKITHHICTNANNFTKLGKKWIKGNFFGNSKQRLGFSQKTQIKELILKCENKGTVRLELNKRTSLSAVLKTFPTIRWTDKHGYNMSKWVKYKGWGHKSCFSVEKKVYTVPKNTLQFVASTIILSSSLCDEVMTWNMEQIKAFIKVQISAPPLGTPGPLPVLGVAPTPL